MLLLAITSRLLMPNILPLCIVGFVEYEKGDITLVLLKISYVLCYKYTTFYILLNEVAAFIFIVCHVMKVTLRNIFWCIF